MADLRWNITYKDETYEFNATQELTGRYLRQMKNWFGTSYGQWASVIHMLTLGDVDAWSSAIWIVLKREGRPCPSTPAMLDFPVGQFLTDLEELEDPDKDDDEDKVDPTQDGPSTGGSKRTTKSLEPVISE